MAELEVTVVAGKDLPRRFQRAGIDVRPTLLRETNAAILLLSAAAEKHIEHNFHRRTGGLEHITIIPAHESIEGMEGGIGWSVPYAAIHEFGGEIHAKNVAHLTIPLNAMKTQAGVARGSARDVITNPGGYGYDSTFSIHGIIFGRSDSGAEPLFALKDSVHIPARPYAQPAIDEVRPAYELGIEKALTGLLTKPA